ncbi:hypothetical protein N9U58_02615 [Pelagibacteraceae bacterium]|nr:hypothetical protein [Pelagibacteraceae bacterium]
MKNIDDIILIQYAEGKLKDDSLIKLIKSNKDYNLKVETYKKTLKQLKDFGKLFNGSDKRTGKEKMNIKFKKIREYMDKKGIKNTGS